MLRLSSLACLGVFLMASSSTAHGMGACSLAAGGKPAAQQWSLSELSWETVIQLKEVLSDIFINSDQVLKLYRSSGKEPQSVAKLGSGLSASSYGIYDARLRGTTTDGIFKVPLRYPLETLFDYFGESIPALPETTDPLDFSDPSPRAVHQRRVAGVAILLQHFFRIVERRTGFKITPELLAAYSRLEVVNLIEKFPEMSFPEDDATRGVYQNLPPKQSNEPVPGRTISDPRELIGFGMVFEKLQIVAEQKDDEKLNDQGQRKTKDEFFRAIPGVQSQILVLAWLLSQLGIELPDASPVLTSNGRVNLIDLDEAIVAIRVRGELVIIGNVEPAKLEYFRQQYIAGKWQNLALLDKAGLTPKDLLRSSQTPRRN